MITIFACKPTQCPACKHALNRAYARQRGSRAPQAGDIALCDWCCTPLIYDGAEQLHVMTTAERAGLSAELADTLERESQWVARLRALYSGNKA